MTSSLACIRSAASSQTAVHLFTIRCFSAGSEAQGLSGHVHSSTSESKAASEEGATGESTSSFSYIPRDEYTWDGENSWEWDYPRTLYFEPVAGLGNRLRALGTIPQSCTDLWPLPEKASCSWFQDSGKTQWVKYFIKRKTLMNHNWACLGIGISPWMRCASAVWACAANLNASKARCDHTQVISTQPLDVNL